MPLYWLCYRHDNRAEPRMDWPLNECYGFTNGNHQTTINHQMAMLRLANARANSRAATWS